MVNKGKRPEGRQLSDKAWDCKELNIGAVERGRRISRVPPTDRTFAYIVILTHTVMRATQEPDRHTPLQKQCAQKHWPSRAHKPLLLCPPNSPLEPPFRHQPWAQFFREGRGQSSVISSGSCCTLGSGAAAGHRSCYFTWRAKTPILKTLQIDHYQH